MSLLADFLKQEAERLDSLRPEREQTVREWTGAVAELLSQIEQWVSDADLGHVLQVERTEHVLREERLGPYRCPGLKISLDGSPAEVVPAARRVVASVRPPGEDQDRRADGRVDFIRYGSAKFVLYRLADPGVGSRWFLVRYSEGVAGRLKAIVEPFTRDVCEAVMVSLFE